MEFRLTRFIAIFAAVVLGRAADRRQRPDPRPGEHLDHGNDEGRGRHQAPPRPRAEPRRPRQGTDAGRASTTARRSIASSTASWRRAATRPAPAWAARTSPTSRRSSPDTNFGRGTIGAARTDEPDSANSQFFICFADCSFLNGKYTVWGEVVEGMDVVDKLNKGEPPANPDKIVKMQRRARNSQKPIRITISGQQIPRTHW